MLGFLVKKAFFDMWDNFLHVFVINLVFLLLATPALLLISGAAPPLPGWAAWLVIAVNLLLLGVFTGAVSEMVKDMVDYQSTGLETFVAGLRASFRTSLILSAANLLLVCVILVGWSFCTRQGSLIGVGGTVILSWIALAWVMVGQLFFPVMSRLDKRPVQVLKKSGLIFLDNSFFMLVVTVGAVAIAVASTVVAGMILGFTTLLIWYHVALKLRLLKYDYLEENPDADRRRIPWDALLVEDREQVGARTLRGMIFPWRD